VLATIALAAGPTLIPAASADASTFAEPVDGAVTAEITTDPLSVDAAATDIAADGTLEVSGTVVITNGTDDALGAGDVQVAVDDEILTTASAHDAWLAATYAPDAPGDDVVVAEVSTGEIAAGESAEVRFATELEVDTTEALQSQLHGIAAQYRVDDEVAEGRATVLLPGETASAPVALTTIVPVTAPLGDNPLLTATDLDALTADDGELTQLLDAVEGTDATLAIDPRVLVSIRALGVDAPQNATDWLERLESLENPSFPLEFADANAALLELGGEDAPLTIDSFDFETRKHDFPEPAEPEPDESPTPSASGTATPEATDPASDEPVDPTSVEALTAFDYTRGDLVWPLATTEADVAGLASNATVVLDSAQVDDATDWSAASGTQQRLGDGEALVVSNRLSTLAADALEATSDAERNAAIGKLTAELALLMGDEAATVTITLPRSAPDASAYADLVATLEGAGVAEVTAPPAEATNPADLGEVAAATGGFSDSTLQRFDQLLQQEESGLTLVDLYDNPDDVREQLRVNLFKAISNQVIEAGTFQESVSAYSSFATGALNGITVEPGSEVQLIGHESSVPVFIENTTNRTVTVRVEARATTGHLRVNSSTTVTVEPNSAARAQIPVEAIANGTSGLSITLWAGDAVQLPSTGSFVVNVHADMENIAIVLGFVLVAALIGFGTWRMLRRRRRHRESGTVPEPATPDSAAPKPVTPDSPTT
jgi:hypothetical protein